MAYFLKHCPVLRGFVIEEGVPGVCWGGSGAQDVQDGWIGLDG